MISCPRSGSLSSCRSANISFASFSASQSSDHFLSVAAEAIMASAELASRANGDPADADRRIVQDSPTLPCLGLERIEACASRTHTVCHVLYSLSVTRPGHFRETRW